MPLSNYNQYFGGRAGSASKAMSAMMEEYGEEKGKSVFYGKVNKEKKKKRNGMAGHGKLGDMP